MEDQKLFLMSHGERIDHTFRNWISSCFDQNGHYTRIDLNMPQSLAQRINGPLDFSKDSPLTRTGIFQSELIGEAFKEAELNVTHVYCSPSFYCVQTCDAFLRACGKRGQVKIKIEPGLFDFLELYTDGLPKFMTLQELKANDFDVDLNYEPFISLEKLAETQETLDDFYSRGYSVTRNVLGANKSDNILFVGHASILDNCSGELLGKNLDMLSRTNFHIRNRKVPRCCFLQLNYRKFWKIAEKQIPGITHRANSNYDWDLFDS